MKSVFHEFGHIKDYASGKLTIGNYIDTAFVVTIDRLFNGSNFASLRSDVWSAHPAERAAVNFETAMLSAYKEAGLPCGPVDR